MKNKVLLIGWDAADWQVIHPLIEQGKMPALKHLIESGVSGNLATLEPVFSPMLWTSIATGKRADKHGVLGFTEPDFQNGGIRPVGSTSRKTAAIWNMLSQEKLKSNVVGWWPSHPTEALNGVMVSNFYQRAVNAYGEDWPIAPGTVFPKKYTKEIADLRVHPQELTAQHILPFVPEAVKIDQDKDKRLSTLGKILAEAACIHNSATHLMQTTEWDFMAVYYDNIDHFCHAFMKYHPPRLKGIKKEDFEIYNEVVNAAYQYHDMMLGRMLNLTDESTTVVLISDHGFESGKNRLLSLPKEAGGPAYDHRSYGIFVASGPNIKEDELIYGANLLDITPTLLPMFNLPLGKDMDGKPLMNIFKESPDLKYIESWDDHVVRKTEEKTDPEAAAEALKMMIELGYVEKPDEKAEVAFEKTRIENEFNLSRVYLSSGRPKQAIEILERLHENEASVRFGSRLAMAYDSIKEHQKCIDMIDDLEKKTKQPIQQLNAIKVASLLKLRRKEAAWKELQPLLKQRPWTALAAQRVARGLMTLKRNKRAAAYLDRALQLFPDNATLRYLKGMAAYRDKDFETAADFFLESINNQFYNPKAHLYLGECMMRMELWEDAHRAFTIAISQNPSSKRALKGLAEIEKRGYKFSFKQAELVSYHSKNVADQEAIENSRKKYLNSLKGTVYIVSGLPRSGTSMMMQMLNAGGAELLIDEKREADESNPKGYLEHEAIKSLGKNKRVIAEAKDKVVKVVSPQLKHLLPTFKYKIIFMERDIREVIASQNKMSNSAKQDYSMKLHQFYEKQIAELNNHLFQQINVEVMKIPYKETIEDPSKTAGLIADFLSELQLDQKKMIAKVDSKLYRNKV